MLLNIIYQEHYSISKSSIPLISKTHITSLSPKRKSHAITTQLFFLIICSSTLFLHNPLFLAFTKQISIRSRIKCFFKLPYLFSIQSIFQPFHTAITDFLFQAITLNHFLHRKYSSHIRTFHTHSFTCKISSHIRNLIPSLTPNI